MYSAVLRLTCRVYYLVLLRLVAEHHQLKNTPKTKNTLRVSFPHSILEGVKSSYPCLVGLQKGKHQHLISMSTASRTSGTNMTTSVSGHDGDIDVRATTNSTVRVYQVLRVDCKCKVAVLRMTRTQRGTIISYLPVLFLVASRSHFRCTGVVGRGDLLGSSHRPAMPNADSRTFPVESIVC